MAQEKTSASSPANPSEEKANEHPNFLTEGLRNFTSYFPKYVKVGGCPHFYLKNGSSVLYFTLCVLSSMQQFSFTKLKKNDHFRSSELSARNNKELSTTSLSLERQMEAWKHNPEWVERPPCIKVTKV